MAVVSAAWEETRAQASENKVRVAVGCHHDREQRKDVHASKQSWCGCSLRRHPWLATLDDPLFFFKKVGLGPRNRSGRRVLVIHRPLFDKKGSPQGPPGAH